VVLLYGAGGTHSMLAHEEMLICLKEEMLSCLKEEMLSCLKEEMLICVKEHCHSPLTFRRPEAEMFFVHLRWESVVSVVGIF